MVSLDVEASISASTAAASGASFDCEHVYTDNSILATPYADEVPSISFLEMNKEGS